MIGVDQQQLVLEGMGSWVGARSLVFFLQLDGLQSLTSCYSSLVNRSSTCRPLLALAFTHFIPLPRYLSSTASLQLSYMSNLFRRLSYRLRHRFLHYLHKLIQLIQCGLPGDIIDEDASMGVAHVLLHDRSVPFLTSRVIIVKTYYLPSIFFLIGT